MNRTLARYVWEKHKDETVKLVRFIVKWSLVGLWVGALAGSASALFLWALELATKTQAEHPRLLYGLPLAGVVIAFVYARFGQDVAGGNNLLLEQVHNPKGEVPWRMAPLILLTTVATHLFGGSAGREGTAVQMGGSLARLGIGRLLHSRDDIRLTILTGIAAGFGSVFGTPLSGAVFGLEVLSVGRMRYDALWPCLVGSVVGDLVCQAWGITHSHYAVTAITITPKLLVLVVFAGACFAAASACFSELTHAISHWGQHLPQARYVKPVLGGCAIIALTWLLGTRDYNGLSLPLLANAVHGEPVSLAAFFLKILFTAITLGSGFKGGEVTPLFVIGATLGNAFAQMTGQPTGYFAALGLVAVFAGAANTPLACAVMGIELFGAEMAVPLALACVTSYILSGHRGIYLAQQIGHPKHTNDDVKSGVTLRAHRAQKERENTEDTEITE